MLLPGCVVCEASQAWLAIVCPVSKLPVKRIISGNDYWHCLPWLMATSQYLTSHHLHQSRCEELLLWHLFVIHFKSGMWLRLLNLLCYEVITGLWSELVYIENWTGCWVMCFVADMPVTAGNNSAPSFLPSFTPHWWHIALCSGDMWARSSAEPRKAVCCVSMEQSDAIKKQRPAFIYQQAHKSSSAFPFARWNTTCSFSETIPK